VIVVVAVAVAVVVVEEEEEKEEEEVAAGSRGSFGTEGGVGEQREWVAGRGCEGEQAKEGTGATVTHTQRAQRTRADAASTLPAAPERGWRWYHRRHDSQTGCIQRAQLSDASMSAEAARASSRHRTAAARRLAATAPTASP
jgi:hypothetical protein